MLCSFARTIHKEILWAVDHHVHPAPEFRVSSRAFRERIGSPARFTRQEIQNVMAEDASRTTAVADRHFSDYDYCRLRIDFGMLLIW
jgi:hypothetical protein